MITKPVLPPKAGYVEVELDGQRVYKNAVTGEIYGQETIPTDKQRIERLEKDAEAVWENMAASIKEGVNEI